MPSPLIRTPPERVAATQELEREFQRLLAQWDRETLFTSNATEMFNHPALQAIIAMGEPAVPLLLAALKRKPDQYVWALKRITGINVLEGPERHELAKVTEAWLRWGRANGYC